mgnify:CR=1 FL=1
MLKLPNVTLICLTNQKFDEHKRAIDKSCEQINFGAVKLIWDEKCNSIDEWNRKIIFDLPKYVDTSHALLIHQDGYIIHPELWKDEWLELDYIGSPWPFKQDGYSYRDEWGQIVRVGNGVSLRSKKLMDLIATRPMVYHHSNNNEDGQICCWNRQWLISQGCKFATFEQALHFGKEVELPENKDLQTFLFHSL